MAWRINVEQRGAGQSVPSNRSAERTSHRAERRGSL
jgi:hypothetical protein